MQRGFVEDPLRRGFQKGHERLSHDFAIEPEMDPGDGRNADVAQIGKRWLEPLDFLSQKIGKRFMRQRKYIAIGAFPAPAIKFHIVHSPASQMDRAQRSAQIHFPAPPLDFRFAAVI